MRFEKADALHFREELLANHSLDFLVSNPPYVPEKDKAEMHQNVLEFEPHLALFVSNEDPLVFYREIAQIASRKLKKGGQLFFEIHEKLAEEMQQLLRDLGFQDVEIREDLQGKKRMARAKSA